jgi:hypothetical protein
VDRVRPPPARLHVRADERHPRPLAPGHRRHRAAAGGDAGSPVQRHGEPARGGPGPAARRVAARAAGQGAAADHRRRVERGGAPDGQAGHRQARDRLVRPVLARHDAGGGQRHLQRRPQGIRAGGARQLRHSGAVPAGRRLAAAAGPRVRPDRRPVGGQPGGLHRGADPQLGRRDRPAAGLPRRPAAEVPGSRHAADPGRGADRPVPHRYPGTPSNATAWSPTS